MAPLAKLPVFLDLAQREAVVAGGSDAAAWKAELFAAAGARVAVYAETADEAMTSLVARGAAAGSIRLIQRPWRPEDLAGAAIAVNDAASDVEAAAFHRAARAAGVMSAVIDDAAHSDFQCGAIVNRSPVVIGIATDGAAPILAQAIRRRIETLLPRTLGRWAAAAKRMRARVAAAIPDRCRRRAFWEAIAERAFTDAANSDPDTAMAGAIETTSTRASAQGKVTLVGAGPGDAELLTLKAVRALQAADVILFDDLVSDDVLELARREAKRMMVGKRDARPSCRQDDINDLMVRLARQGKRVVRLKSGDPMIFGRAGEEIARLEAAGIAVEIVPGITAGIAAAAALGISLTHRDGAQSVRFVTGHSRQGGLPEGLDWSGLADPHTTLIVYMGGRTAGTLAARLVAAGLSPATPAVAVAGVSRPGERRWQGRLDALASGVAALGGDDPVLIGIGTVFRAAKPALASVRAFQPLLAGRNASSARVATARS